MYIPGALQMHFFSFLIAVSRLIIGFEVPDRNELIHHNMLMDSSQVVIEEARLIESTHK
jgi:hypothetical protein